VPKAYSPKCLEGEFSEVQSIEEANICPSIRGSGAEAFHYSGTTLPAGAGYYLVLSCPPTQTS
jgi:hypothetical protein